MVVEYTCGLFFFFYYDDLVPQRCMSFLRTKCKQRKMAKLEPPCHNPVHRGRYWSRKSSNGRLWNGVPEVGREEWSGDRKLLKKV